MGKIRATFVLLPLLLSAVCGGGIGEIQRIPQYSTADSYQPSWLRSDSSALEVRSINGFGRRAPISTPKPNVKSSPEESIEDLNDIPKGVNRLEDRGEGDFVFNGPAIEENPMADEKMGSEKFGDIDESPELPFPRFFKTRVAMRVLIPEDNDKPKLDQQKQSKPAGSRARVRRESESQMEKIGATKTVREARLGSPESWSKQPLSVEFRHRSSLDEAAPNRDQEDPVEPQGIRPYQTPQADFVTGHQHRRSYPEARESRDLPVTRGYEDYDLPWYRNSLRERDYYDVPTYRRAYRYPDRYRMERDYYMRPYDPPSYYYDRYRDDDYDLYGRARPAQVKPKRIIYYATLPEVVRKPVDLRNYPRPYDGSTRPTSTARDSTYRRVPGNVDPNRYRYRQPYDTYDPYSKRSSFYDRPYISYPEDDVRRKNTYKDTLRQDDLYESGQDRKLSSHLSVRESGPLPWPVQIGTEVSVKDDERITGRKIFGDSNGFERIQSAQLQKAPDATTSTETQKEN